MRFTIIRAVFLNRQDAKGAKKNNENAGDCWYRLYDSSAFFVLFVNFVVKHRSRQKLEERDKQMLFSIFMSETMETF